MSHDTHETQSAQAPEAARTLAIAQLHDAQARAMTESLEAAQAVAAAEAAAAGEARALAVARDAAQALEAARSHAGAQTMEAAQADEKAQVAVACELQATAAAAQAVQARNAAEARAGAAALEAAEARAALESLESMRAGKVAEAAAAVEARALAVARDAAQVLEAAQSHANAESIQAAQADRNVQAAAACEMDAAAAAGQAAQARMAAQAYVDTLASEAAQAHADALRWEAVLLGDASASGPTAVVPGDSLAGQAVPPHATTKASGVALPNAAVEPTAHALLDAWQSFAVPADGSVAQHVPHAATQAESFASGAVGAATQLMNAGAYHGAQHAGLLKGVLAVSMVVGAGSALLWAPVMTPVAGVFIGTAAMGSMHYQEGDNPVTQAFTDFGSYCGASLGRVAHEVGFKGLAPLVRGIYHAAKSYSEFARKAGSGHASEVTGSGTFQAHKSLMVTASHGDNIPGKSGLLTSFVVGSIGYTGCNAIKGALMAAVAAQTAAAVTSLVSTACDYLTDSGISEMAHDPDASALDARTSGALDDSALGYWPTMLTGVWTSEYA